MTACSAARSTGTWPGFSGTPRPPPRSMASHVRKALGQFAEHQPDFLPVAHVEHAAARVRMQRHDARAHLLHQPFDLVDFEQWHAELGMHAGGPHVIVMAAAEAGVDAHQHVAAAEQLAPLTQGVNVIDRQVDALLDRPFVFAARREIGREQDAARVDTRHHLHHVLAFAARNTLEGQAKPGKGLEQLRVRVRFHRVEDAIDATDAEQLMRRAFERRPVVDVRAALFVRDPLQFVAACCHQGGPPAGSTGPSPWICSQVGPST